MTTPVQPTDPAATPAEPVVEPAAQALKVTPAEETPPVNDIESLPAWARDQLSKKNREAQNLRDRLKEAEPLVQQAREAEEANKTELQRATERSEALHQSLLQRENELLATRYGLGEDYVEFIGATGTYEEREARAVKMGLLAQSAQESGRAPSPPTNRPIETLRSGASPTPPLAEDHSYPANWGFMPGRDS